MNMSEDRYLPKWAKEEMARKDRLLQSLGERVAEMDAFLSGDGNSLFSIPDNANTSDYKLPGFARHMTIELPNGFRLDVQPQSEGNGGIGTKDTIQFMVTSHHGLAIMPQSGNVVQLGPRRL